MRHEPVPGWHCTTVISWRRQTKILSNALRRHLGGRKRYNTTKPLRVSDAFHELAWRMKTLERQMVSRCSHDRSRWYCVPVDLFAITLVITLAGDARSDTPEIVNCDGYPCLNFAFGANVSREGELFRSLYFNRPQLGEGLDPLGGGDFTFQVGDGFLSASNCMKRQVQRAWPFATVQLRDTRLNDVELRAVVTVPNGIDDVFVGTLPIAMAEWTLTNHSSTARTGTIRFNGERFFRTTPDRLENEGVDGMVADRNFFAWMKPTKASVTGSTCEVRVEIPAGQSVKARCMVGHWEENWPSSARLQDVSELSAHVARFWDRLFAGSARVDAALPQTGDETLDDYLRWYTAAGVAMTRALKDGTALTMGYHELNQRDSFWTTWVHLVHWPSLERRMIEETMWGQRENGKVPTTILPLIEREDDIDINCYFILRALRYVRYHRDDEIGKKVLPSLILAANWLIDRDREGSGLPQANSYWYDWKDVSGVSGRKYSPYASMLYISALSQLAEYCDSNGIESAAKRFRSRAEQGLALLNRPIDDGGLWNGGYYQQVWADGRNSSEVLEDQVVGILFRVVRDERADSVLQTLENNASRWGYRKTFPFHPDGFGYKGGDYHNGGIWPWLNQVHAWTLLQAGHRTRAIEMLKRLGAADLEQDGDFIPHEYLNGTNGRQAGVPMQGWNAAMFGAIHFGMKDKGHLP